MDVEIPSAESVAPRVRKITTSAQTTTGTTTIDTDNNLVGIHVLTLRATNTGVDIGGDPRPGTVIVLAIRQGAGAPWTWAPGGNLKFAGGSPGPTATVQNHRDIYTLIYDGAEWNETARALDVG